MDTLPTAHAIELVQAFRNLHVLVIGDSLLDSYLEGEAARLSRDGPIPVVRKTTEQRLPGGAANVAANIHALGAQVSFLSVVGADIAGEFLRETLHERGLDMQGLLVDTTFHTPHKLRIVADGQHIARFDEGEARMTSFASETHQRLLERLEMLYMECDAVLLSDYGYGVLSPDLLARLQMLQQSAPKVMLVDAQELARFWHFPATVVTPNYQEACRCTEALFGKQEYMDSGDDQEQLKQAEHLAGLMRSALEAEYIAITLSSQGVVVQGRQEKAFHIPAHSVAVAHDVGAGDSFASALILALAAGGSIEEATQIGVDSAGIAVTKPRTAVVSYQELLQRVSLRVYTQQVQKLQNDHAHDPIVRLAAQLEVERLAGHRIILTNGVFDILHVGHIHFLRQAKALGDVLVVGVNSDESTRRLKGPGRPFTPEQDRLALVAALDMVDYSLLFAEDTAESLIHTLRPDLYVKGSDYTDETLPETEAVHAIGGQVVILPLIGSVRTQGVIERIQGR